MTDATDTGDAPTADTGDAPTATTTADGTTTSGASSATSALDDGPAVLAVYAVVQVLVVTFSYLAVSTLGLASPGFVHLDLPWALVVPGVWLLVLGFAARALVPRIRAAG